MTLRNIALAVTVPYNFSFCASRQAGAAQAVCYRMSVQPMFRLAATRQKPSWGKIGSRTFVFVAVAVPWLSLALKALALGAYKIDLPYWDDWRHFNKRGVGSVDLDHLFQSSNDTLYATGKFLDSIVFAQLLNSNVVVYEILTLLMVMGLILFMQQGLLFHLVANRMIAAAAFFTTVLMLQPGGYWGKQYINFHQAIPIVAILAMLGLALKPPSWARDLALSALALAAGFAYTSGAFAALVVALVLLAHSFLPGPGKLRLLRAGLVVGVASLITCFFQGRVILVTQGGKVHRPDAPWTPPTDADFWFYVLGKFGRAFALPLEQPASSLAITVLVLALGAVSAVYLLYPIWSGRSSAIKQPLGKPGRVRARAFSAVLLSIAAAVIVYLVMVGSGRAGLRPEYINSDLQIFSFGFNRFHFFWVTILTPWIAATLLLALRKFAGDGWLPRAASVGLVILVGALGLTQGLFAHAAWYEQVARPQEEGLRCMQMHIREGRSEIYCPTIFRRDIMKGYLHGLSIGASFTRYMPDPVNLPFLPKDDAVFFRLSRSSAADIQLNQASVVDGPLLSIATHNDPMVIVPLAPVQARSCKQLQVVVKQEIERPSFVEVFYRSPSDASYSRGRSVRVAQAKDTEERSLVINSARGFAPEIRIDPVTDAQRIVVRDIRIGCLRQD